MASVTIRNLDEDTKARLRLRAAIHGRSMEEELREIVRTALAEPAQSAGNLADAIRERFAAAGGEDLEIPERTPMREPVAFEP